MLRVDEERLKRGWSKHRLAREADMADSQAIDICNGRRVPGPVPLKRLAAALGWEGDPAALLEDVGHNGADSGGQ